MPAFTYARPHPVLRPPAVYVVQPGDTLSGIAASVYGHANRWPALWYANRQAIRDPAALQPGTILDLSSWHPVRAWLTAKAMAAMPQAKAAAAAPAAQASPAPPQPVSASGGSPVPSPAPAPPPSGSGIYSYGALEALWVSAGGPAGVESTMATIAECESGGNPQAYNASGASGLWQILGQVVPGNIFDPMVNALNAVKKYLDAGSSTSPWVCQ